MSNAFDISLIPFSFCNPGRSEVSKKLNSASDADCAALNVLVRSLFLHSTNIAASTLRGKWEKSMSKQRSLSL